MSTKSSRSNVGRRKNKQEVPNKFLDKLSSDEFILNPTSTTFENIINTDYEELKEKMIEIEHYYNINTLKILEDTYKLLEERREVLKKIAKESNPDIKLPRTSSKIKKLLEVINERKEKLLRYGISIDSCSSNNNVARRPKRDKITDNNQKIENIKLPLTKEDRVLVDSKKKKDKTNCPKLPTEKNDGLQKMDVEEKKLANEEIEEKQEIPKRPRRGRKPKENKM
ncbi:Hypothetical protein SRAE_X000212800 [Strongyloides ratti]|uniref:Uncharacterized protein n=1 Tax=Strongyloides ratti TaxID=34506 RepID=A0A090KS98_STRRB|nr:Hypothetical protein SRAE_X000212800 [Strongyloides ratti]CEF60390.1 Hypothetical protein SRAE_X000212800 [Strongyloides ratti]